MNSARQDSMSEAEIQTLLDAWVLVRSKVWNASYGVMAANAPAGWKQFLELSARPYEQMVEAVLKVQAAGVSTALHTLEQVTAMQQLVAPWGEAMRGFVDAAAQIQRPTAEAQSAALAEQDAQATTDEARALTGEPVPERVPADPAALGGSGGIDNTARSATPRAEDAPMSFEQEGARPERRAEDRPFSRKDAPRDAAAATAGNVRGRGGKSGN
jgi:hypothetical protein